jgi:hypothetical protein
MQEFHNTYTEAIIAQFLKDIIEPRESIAMIAAQQTQKQSHK